ncbi:uncharacterized protein A1O9_04024 [Exophiala aquamarina CBS 119918]|uniref:Cellulose-binding protein n=1 Tax=Exophiala aquamarina CBS 119918 TaxID=1182545 RepID=A0A072PUH7_9EURO|nr:uncharacterized protein A1O9_04024 [Exophiala aquamarina CBS 119918]KEF59180.1 hypothetical protein A1O9_04024 [Exophiala aquamarina CBS 119918]
MVDTTRLRVCRKKLRVFIVSDISNEPDDAESLVRYLLYANEFDTRGLVACTSTWMKRVVHPEDMQKIVRAYSKVVDSLNQNTHPDNPYPSGDSIMDLITTGPAVYGKEALQPDVPLSQGAKLLLNRLDESDEPLWILCWGGTNVLAQALQHSQLSRTHSEHSKLRSKMRVYAISDQDDTGMWIRYNFPDIFYIASVHGWNQYGLAAWTGISGDQYYLFDQGGPDFKKFTKEWLKENIQIGPLGEAYPDYLFIPEGDTPTFLYLVQNGLGSPEHPEWGSWGGRYLRTDLGEAGKHYTDAVDRVMGANRQNYISNHATIWRWREAFQNDFAARIQWTLGKNPSECNHAPVAIVNDSPAGPESCYIEAEAGAIITLDATQSYDPDGDDLTFTWFQYSDVTASQWWVDAEVHSCKIEDLDGEKSGRVVSIRLPPPEKCAIDMFSGEPQQKGQTLHFILEVKDNGMPQLRTYKRVVVQITNKELRGRREQAVESIADVHGFDGD